MTVVFLGVLALAWMTFILPAALRARHAAPLSQAERFKRRLRLIAPARSSPATRSGRWVLVPDMSYDAETRERLARDRRIRSISLSILVASVIGSAVVGLVVGGRAWAVHLAFDGSLTLYLGLLIHARARRAEQRAKVRRLQAVRAAGALFVQPLDLPPIADEEQAG